jgi:hypothetical protein
MTKKNKKYLKEVQSEHFIFDDQNKSQLNKESKEDNNEEPNEDPKKDHKEQPKEDPKKDTNEEHNQEHNQDPNEEHKQEPKEDYKEQPKEEPKKENYKEEYKKDLSNTLDKLNTVNTLNTLNTLNVLFTYIYEGNSINRIDNNDLNNWIKYHLELGFSHIYISVFGNHMVHPLNYSKDLVTVIRINTNFPLDTMIKQSYDFSNKYKFDWMLILRYNEYLYLGEKDLNQYLSDKKMYDQVMISNRSIINMNQKNRPTFYNNYYVTFSDMSKSYMNSDLKNFIMHK